MTGNKVSAAIVTYNRLDLLKESLAAVLNQTDYLSHVIVVDNMSNDGTKEYLDGVEDDRVVVFHSTENLGGAGGFNKAVRLFAEETEDDFVWLMDDDTIAQPDALKYLVDFYNSHQPVGFVNSVVRWGNVDGHPSWMNIQGPRAFTYPMYFNDLENPGLEVVNSSFVSVMIPREMVQSVGLPQKEYFIWGDDIEYTNRIADIHRGYTALKSVVVHKSKENTMPGDILREQDDARLWRYEYEFRNRLLTARRLRRREFINMAKGGIQHELMHVLFAPGIKFRARKAKMILNGTWRGLFFKPEIEFANVPRNHEARSINTLLRARFLAAPDERITLDEEVDIIKNGKLSDYAGENAKVDAFLKEVADEANRLKESK
jgi:GT2 family glycosyltransferase